MSTIIRRPAVATSQEPYMRFSSARAATAFASLAMLVAALGAPFKWG